MNGGYPIHSPEAKAFLLARDLRANGQRSIVLTEEEFFARLREIDEAARIKRVKRERARKWNAAIARDGLRRVMKQLGCDAAKGAK